MTRMSPQEVIASALTARFRAKNGGTDEIIRSSHRDSASIAVQALLDAGYAMVDTAQANAEAPTHAKTSEVPPSPE